MAIILDGKKLSEKKKEIFKKEISKLKIKPALAIVQVGNRPESNAYIGRKKRYASEIGAIAHHIILPENIPEKKVKELITELNLRKDIHGIIVQLPIPKQLDRYSVIEAIDPKKDVDGLSSINAGLLYERAFGGQDPKNVPEGPIPATAKGVMEILAEYKIPLGGKNVLVIGRSLLIGKPIAMLLMGQDATVTVAHSKTKNLLGMVKNFDVIIVAIGKAEFLKGKYFKKGQVVIDVGINAVVGAKMSEEIGVRKLVGDVEYEKAKKIVKAITPVPGGVGPMTVSCLFENLLEVYKKQYEY